MESDVEECKRSVCTGDSKDPVAGLELSVVSHANLYQETEASAKEG